MAYQVSIFLENKIGHLRHITTLLAENQINIRTMNLTHTSNDWGVLNLIVDLPDKAYQSLNAHNVSVALREVIALEMDDHPGGMDDLLEKVEKAGVNFTNAYSRILKEGNEAFLILDSADTDQTREQLKTVGLIPLDDKMVYGK
jgi:hypothetical protein